MPKTRSLLATRLNVLFCFGSDAGYLFLGCGASPCLPFHFLSFTFCLFPACTLIAVDFFFSAVYVARLAVIVVPVDTLLSSSLLSCYIPT